MSDGSPIEWLARPGTKPASWNPIRARWPAYDRVGWHCEHVSEGCRNCYAESMNAWRGTRLPFKPGHRDSLEHFLDAETKAKPESWRDRRTVFVCSMSDLFGAWVYPAWIVELLDRMARAERHTFIVLTKRAPRMLAVMRERYPTPLPNVWLGVSIEDQATAMERLPLLLKTPAALRFVSAEPLLGPIDIGTIVRACTVAGAIHEDGKTHPLGWVIAGGESGRSARPMQPSWARRLRDDCRAAGVPFFFKQWGAWSWSRQDESLPPVYLGKAAAGAMLDGREHREWPA